MIFTSVDKFSNDFVSAANTLLATDNSLRQRKMSPDAFEAGTGLRRTTSFAARGHRISRHYHEFFDPIIHGGTVETSPALLLRVNRRPDEFRIAVQELFNDNDASQEQQDTALEACENLFSYLMSRIVADIYQAEPLSPSREAELLKPVELFYSEIDRLRRTDTVFNSFANKISELLDGFELETARVAYEVENGTLPDDSDIQAEGFKANYCPYVFRNDSLQRRAEAPPASVQQDSDIERMINDINSRPDRFLEILDRAMDCNERSLNKELATISKLLDAIAQELVLPFTLIGQTRLDAAEEARLVKAAELMQQALRARKASAKPLNNFGEALQDRLDRFIYQMTKAKFEAMASREAEFPQSAASDLADYIEEFAPYIFKDGKLNRQS